MAVSFAGHSSLEGVVKRQLRLGKGAHLSRPPHALKGIPARVMAWHGVAFRNDERPPSEAELDARTFADMERGLR